MSRQTKVNRERQREEASATAKRLRALFTEWAREEAEGRYDDEPPLEEIQEGFDEEREREGYPRKLFPEG